MHTTHLRISNTAFWRLWAYTNKREVRMKLSSSWVPFAAAALAIQVQAAAPTNVVIPSGYTLSAVATGLNFPTAITFQGDSIWVTEAGIITPPAVKEIDNKGNITTVLTAS